MADFKSFREPQKGNMKDIPKFPSTARSIIKTQIKDIQSILSSSLKIQVLEESTI